MSEEIKKKANDLALDLMMDELVNLKTVTTKSDKEREFIIKSFQVTKEAEQVTTELDLSSTATEILLQMLRGEKPDGDN